MKYEAVRLLDLSIADPITTPKFEVRLVHFGFLLI